MTPMFEPSSLDAGEWRLSVGGEVEKPMSLSLAELSKIESHSVTNTLECAGNGRAFHKPQLPGVQWEKGAVGNARFTGPRLADILKRAGVKATGKHVMFRGLDEVPGKVPPFVRSIPIEKAMDSDTLVATHMPQNYVPIFIFLGVIAVLLPLTLLAAKLVRPENPNRTKLMPYECGIDPVDSARGRYTVRYYIVAILFVVFDVETIFLFPWAVQFKALGLFGLLEMFIFLGILVIGYLWIWKKGALEWV